MRFQVNKQAFKKSFALIPGIIQIKGGFIMKTLKLSELITALWSIKQQTGDLPVYMSSDEEGNSFGTISKKSFSEEGNCIVIWPFEELEDLNS